METFHLNPLEITEKFVEIGYKKTNKTPYTLLLLGILAGAFIAFASQGSNAAIYAIESAGVGKALAGALFSTGLMMVIITGSELFTGNALIIVSCLEGKSKWSNMLKNWIFVYIGNFIGSIIIAFFIFKSGQLNFSGGLLGGFTIKTAVYKTNLSFGNAFFMGILCNWLVCIAVWMAASTKDIGGKLWAIFFPIWLFITSGFEHSIANMYYIPAGILAKSNLLWSQNAISLGVTAQEIEGLNWINLLTKNLFPVTLGNIIGGCVFVGLFYWLSFLYNKKDKKNNTRRNTYAN